MTALRTLNKASRIHQLMKCFRRLGADEGGSFATFFALAAVPLLGFVGVSVDYSRALASKSAMQGAADATALALAKQISETSGTLQAQPTFNSLFTRPDVQVTSVSSSVASSGNSDLVTVIAEGSISTTFLHILGYSAIPLQARSSASIATDSDGCVLALDATADSAVSLGGSTNVNLNSCTVYSNSASTVALSASGTSTLNAEAIGAVGDVSISSSNVVTTDGIHTHLQGIRDPYADVQMPPFSGCTDHNLNVKATMTIDPGVYCNGISVNAGGTLNLNPGVYIVDRGTFAVNGGGTVVGKGVTIVFTSSTGSNWADVTINGNASVTLTAPIGGATAGLVFFADRNAPKGIAFKLNGGSSQILGGAVYVPTGAVSYSGGAASSASCTQIIGDTVNFTGNSSVAINCSGYATKPFGATSLRLIS